MSKNKLEGSSSIGKDFENTLEGQTPKVLLAIVFVHS